MKIGIDARLYRSSAAGIGRYSQNLIKNLLEIDSENEYVLFMTPEDAEEFRLKNDDLRMKNVKIIETEIGHYSLAEQTKLPKIIEQEKCDLVHFLNFNHPVRFKGKFVVTIHDLTLFFYPGRNKNNLIYKLAYKYIFQKACQNSQKIIAVSQSTKNDIIEKFKIQSSKIKVIHEAADDKTFSQVSSKTIEKLKSRYDIGKMSAKRGSADSGPVLLYVGQWRPHKNLLGLIKAFEILRPEMPAKLAIVGEPDKAFPETQKAIDKSLFLGDIILPGFKTGQDLAAWYKIARVFVFPSFYEGFGLPGLEAMRVGVPVVSSDRTSLPEIYGDAAVYFNPAEPQDMARQIKKVITDEDLRLELIRKGQAKVKEYSWQKTAEETLGVYREILNPKF